MCWEDVSIGRRSKPEWASVPVTAAGGELIAADHTRLTLIISVPVGATILVWPDNSVSATKGMTLLGTTQPLRLNIADDGALVTGAWFAISPGGNVQIAVLATYIEGKPS